MRHLPTDLDIHLVENEVRQQYCFTSRDFSIELSELGQDSWCFQLGQLWVSVRRDLAGHQPVAYETAHALAARGCNWVLAPLAGKDGKVVRTVCGYPIVVFPVLQLERLSDSWNLESGDSARVGQLIEMLHSQAPLPGITVERFAVPFVHDLLMHVGRAAAGEGSDGPFAAQLRIAARTNIEAISNCASRISELANACRETSEKDFVLTHGDLSPGNLMRAGNRIVMLDFGGLLMAPRERDFEALSRNFRITTQRVNERTQFYSLRWQLSELSEYFAHFIQLHRGHGDNEAFWRRLTQFLPQQLNSNTGSMRCLY